MPWCSTNQLLLSGPKRRIFILTSLLGLQSQAGGYTIAPSQKGTDVTPRSQAPCDRMGVVQKVQLPLVKFLSRLLSALVSHPGTGQEQVVALAASCPHPRELPEWIPAMTPPHCHPSFTWMFWIRSGEEAILPDARPRAGGHREQSPLPHFSVAARCMVQCGPARGFQASAGVSLGGEKVGPRSPGGNRGGGEAPELVGTPGVPTPLSPRRQRSPCS